MKGVIVIGGTLAEAIDIIQKAFINVANQFDELNEILKDCLVYKEELEYKERIRFSRTVVKAMKSQVLNRKPLLIRARTTC
ncbi:hypothetical protein ABES36_10935 [Bacillus pseudomycoides]|uniref:hypothetical protein n=1 Tax=Bacillus pseudomycoides TaxID=64104 RepID=UPI003D21B642